MTHTAIFQVFWSNTIVLWNLSHSCLIIFHSAVLSNIKSGAISYKTLLWYFYGAFYGSINFNYIEKSGIFYKNFSFFKRKISCRFETIWEWVMITECSVLFLIFIDLLQKCTFTSFILHSRCVFCGKVFSFTRKRISRAQSFTWEFVESL